MDDANWSRQQLIEELANLRARAEQATDLEKALAQAQDALDTQSARLQERVKKLDCLLGVSNLIERPGITLPEILQGVADLIVPAWQYPEITCARITCDDLVAETAGFRPTEWELAAGLLVHGRRAGAVQVCYLEERPECDEGPFLQEERNLLAAIAERLGRIVERMRAEAAFKQSEATARALLDAPPDAVAILFDAQGIVLDANELLAQRLGVARPDLVGRTVWELLEPQVASGRRAVFDGVISSGQPTYYEDERAGTWFSHALHPVIDNQGLVIRVAVLSQDITERKQAELERDSAKALLEKAHSELEVRIQERTSVLSDTVSILRREILARENAEETLVRVNRRLRMLIQCGQALMRAESETEMLDQVCRIATETGGYRLAWVGYAQEDGAKLVLPVAQSGFEEGYLEGLNITWDDTERGRGPTGTAIRTGQPAPARSIQTDPAFAPWREEAIKRGYASSLALPLQARDRMLGSLNIYASEPDAFGPAETELLSQLAGDLASGILSVRDRQRRHHAEESLRQRVEELTALYRLGQTLSGSRSIEQAVGAALEQVSGLFAHDATFLFLREGEGLILAGSRAADGGSIHKAGPDHRVGECLCGLAVRDGTPIYSQDIHGDPRCTWEECKAAGMRSVAVLPLRTGAAGLGALVLASSDVLNFEKRAAFLETIADLVSVTVNNIQLATEAADLEILREVDRLRSELLANVSHEIRTPLGLIEVGTSSLLMEDVQLDAAIQREFLSGILQETRRLKALVNDLLSQSQIESGTLRPFVQTVDLGPLAFAQARAFQAQTTEHQVVVDLPPEPLLASVDDRQIEQVLSNLLSNAIRYSPDGGIIRLRGRREGDDLVLCVADEGVGIPAEEQDRIFERFYRVDSELTRRVGGVGLGLAVCQGIVASCGGTISVDSAPGEGSEFCFTVPAAPQKGPTAQVGTGLEYSEPKL